MGRFERRAMAREVPLAGPQQDVTAALPREVPTTASERQGTFRPRFRPISTQFPEIEWRVPRSAVDSVDYYALEDRRWNVKAVAAAPVAIGVVVAAALMRSTPLLLIGGALAFALGLIASRQCRDREERGKGFAMAGMILGGLALFISLMALILAG
ncbi:MAG: DUF4190 domain-containing protein [Flavobacteriales bacterium]|nr:DUF4190 domain-containing protein [Flavobacteriales bacterium]